MNIQWSKYNQFHTIVLSVTSHIINTSFSPIKKKKQKTLPWCSQNKCIKVNITKTFFFGWDHSHTSVITSLRFLKTKISGDDIHLCSVLSVKARSDYQSSRP